MCRQLDLVAADPAIRLALRLILLTLVRKSELIEATWDKVDFNTAIWTIPKARMKGRRHGGLFCDRMSGRDGLCSMQPSRRLEERIRSATIARPTVGAAVCNCFPGFLSIHLTLDTKCGRS